MNPVELNPFAGESYEQWLQNQESDEWWDADDGSEEYSYHDTDYPETEDKYNESFKYEENRKSDSGKSASEDAEDPDYNEDLKKAEHRREE